MPLSKTIIHQELTSLQDDITYIIDESTQLIPYPETTVQKTKLQVATSMGRRFIITSDIHEIKMVSGMVHVFILDEQEARNIFDRFLKEYPKHHHLKASPSYTYFADTLGLPYQSMLRFFAVGHALGYCDIINEDDPLFAGPDRLQTAKNMLAPFIRIK